MAKVDGCAGPSGAGCSPGGAVGCTNRQSELTPSTCCSDPHPILPTPTRGKRLGFPGIACPCACPPSEGLKTEVHCPDPDDCTGSSD
eukprot:3904615-Amphidinium_carterae.1